MRVRLLDFTKYADNSTNFTYLPLRFDIKEWHIDKTFKQTKRDNSNEFMLTLSELDTMFNTAIMYHSPPSDRNRYEILTSLVISPEYYS